MSAVALLESPMYVYVSVPAQVPQEKALEFQS